MDECLDRLGDPIFFTSLDCNSVYCQIPVAPEERLTTSCPSRARCFQSFWMPFGLFDAPPTLERTVDVLLSRYKRRSCIVHLDAIALFSDSLKHHLHHSDEVLTVFRIAGVLPKLANCVFVASRVTYLGHIMHPGILDVASKSNATVKGSKALANRSEVSSFLQLCNVYLPFVPDLAKIGAPLNATLKKRVPFQISDVIRVQVESLELLKGALAEQPLLRFPDEGLFFSVASGAC